MTLLAGTGTALTMGMNTNVGPPHCELASLQDVIVDGRGYCWNSAKISRLEGYNP